MRLNDYRLLFLVQQHPCILPGKGVRNVHAPFCFVPYICIGEGRSIDLLRYYTKDPSSKMKQTFNLVLPTPTCLIMIDLGIQFLRRAQEIMAVSSTHLWNQRADFNGIHWIQMPIGQKLEPYLVALYKTWLYGWVRSQRLVTMSYSNRVTV